MKKTIIGAAAILLTLSSCVSSRQAAINDLRNFTQNMQRNSYNYSLDDWASAGKEYYNINKKIKKHATEYTDSEMQEISNLSGQCVRNFSEGAVTKVNGATSLLNSFLEGFMK